MTTLDNKIAYLTEAKSQLFVAINGILAERGEPLLTSASTFREYANSIFNPLALFANGEQGAFIDVSQKSLSSIRVETSPGVPAEFGQTVQRVVDKLGQHNPVQDNSSLKPVYGRVPVGGRRNLWVNSDNISTFTQRSRIIETDLVSPDGVSKVYKWNPSFKEDPGGKSFTEDFYRGISTEDGDLITQSIYVKPINAISRYPNPPDESEADRQVRLTLSQDAGEAAALNLYTMQIVAGADRAFLEDLENGWYRFSVTYTARTDSSNNQFFSFSNRTTVSFGPAPSGEEEVLIAALQVEYAKFSDSPPTPFQKVLSSFDVYEPNADHIEYLRFDFVDDRMSHTFPDGFQGDLIVCGTLGSWVDENVVIPAGGELTIGPKNLPNTPNILPALGDIIGWVPVSRTTTEEERAAIIGYYKKKGAADRLTAGDLV